MGERLKIEEMSARKNKWVKSAFSNSECQDIKKIASAKRSRSVLQTAQELGSTSLASTRKHAQCSFTNQKCDNTPPTSTNWIDAFAPKKIDDLAVHPKKIEEIQEWLKHCDAMRKECPAQICLLTGPTGSGKTATVRLLAEASDYDVQEWINPIDQETVITLGDQKSSFINSQIDLFKGFLLRASRYKSLFSNFSKHLILVEDFPNALINDSTAFSPVLEDFMCYGKSPLVFIVTDAKSKKLNIFYNLFPEDVRAKYNIKHISFNSVASTLMVKAIKRFCSIMSQQGRANIYKAPDPSIVDSIAFSSHGDIRNALINLHFSSLKGAPSVATKTLELASKGRSQKKHFALQSVGRDESISMLHILGRIFNPKYNDKKQFTHNPESLVEQLSTEPKKILNFIHANYLTHFSTIENIVPAADDLSRADVILNDYREESLTYVALNIAIRGSMVANSSPAPGWKPVRGPKRLDIATPTAGNLEKYGLPLNISRNLFYSEYSTYLKHIPKCPK